MTHSVKNSPTATITLAPPLPPPQELDAIVEEQDTALLLGGEPVIREPVADLGQLVKRMQRQTPRTPGEVIVRDGRPLLFQAVVHDLDREPSWRGEWIDAALRHLLLELNRYQVGTVAMPILGSVHGRFNLGEFVSLLHTTLNQNPPASLRKIWLIAPATCRDFIRDFL